MRGMMDIALVVSSKAQAGGLARAQRAGVKTRVLPKQIDWAELTKTLRAQGVQKIFLAGFMRILPAAFVAEWVGCILNVHPSLLPDYAGLNSIERAYADHHNIGLSVHEVTQDVDAGKIIYQRKVIGKEQISRYSLESATFLIHVSEHRLVREAVSRWKINSMSS
jgi:phosphoribosylglycinamide formyltransferase-1